MAEYTNFIPQNVAPVNATGISVYRNGIKVGKIALGSLAPTSLGRKLYSFGALSDVHIPKTEGETQAIADFTTALDYLVNTENVEFTCVCGDLTVDGHPTEMNNYKNVINSKSPNTPVYSIAGNHEGYWELYNTTNMANLFQSVLGHSMWYSFTQGNDVFIMVSNTSYGQKAVFTAEELQWLYETLEANRNKRCFLFQHIRPDDVCGNAYGIYASDIWNENLNETKVFESLISHYKNVIMFHGHSHLTFNLQTNDNLANYDNIFGIHSIHIPSLAAPRTGDITGANSRTELYAESEGYVVDVYANHIVLRGRDFKNGNFLPIATYCLDTTLKTIAAGTYTDSTGTITT